MLKNLPAFAMCKSIALAVNPSCTFQTRPQPSESGCHTITVISHCVPINHCNPSFHHFPSCSRQILMFVIKPPQTYQCPITHSKHAPTKTCLGRRYAHMITYLGPWKNRGVSYFHQLIGLKEQLQETPIVHRKIDGF